MLMGTAHATSEILNTRSRPMGLLKKQQGLFVKVIGRDCKWYELEKEFTHGGDVVVLGRFLGARLGEGGSSLIADPCFQ